MEFRQIRYFLEVHRAGSFVRAAAALGLTQPALSRQIALLERELGDTVFERSGRNVRLTPAGERMLGYATRMQDLWLEMHDGLRGTDEQLNGEYSISAGGTVAAWILPRLLRRLRKHYPDLSFRIYEGDALETRDSLLRRDVDLGILTGETQEAGLVTRPFVKDRIVPVAATRHPIHSRNRLRFKDIEDEDFVLFHPASAIRREVERKLRQIRPGFSPRVVMEGRSVESVVKNIEEGLGIGFVSELSLTSRLKVVALKEDVSVERQFYFCFHRHHRPGLPLLIAALEKHAN